MEQEVKQPTPKEVFMQVFDQEDGEILRVLTQYEAMPKSEMTENPKENFEFLKDYYESALNDDLSLRDGKGCIVGAELVVGNQALRLEVDDRDTPEEQ